ncbi:hypothetical protein PR202_gn00024 [Eleusine coracana subsp. coracana]|uniref:Uncharacterized protein n=1 Tax=Eleusine coracana subsp. coracana TaxID=191504 RepID=A0AAV5F7P5_ELECO|nr:hypothetical protein PR202_gb20099 [Eleusine coracana subsp. coracana]GJN40731.1 hypothetical protein PR202_gn00024 [Eleusine coracana subsp. coracana]
MLDVSCWMIKAVDKLKCNFLWRGKADARGGHCPIAWGKVTRPLNFGGLGIHNLDILGWVCMRWLWHHKIDPSKPWGQLPIQVPTKVMAMFWISVITTAGDGCNMSFWTDRWLHGQSI